jgi:hypothetical protein
MRRLSELNGQEGCFLLNSKRSKPSHSCSSVGKLDFHFDVSDEFDRNRADRRAIWQPDSASETDSKRYCICFGSDFEPSTGPVLWDEPICPKQVNRRPIEGNGWSENCGARGRSDA